VKVAASHLDHLLEQFAERYSWHRRTLSCLQNRFAQHFFHRRLARATLINPAAPQRNHALSIAFFFNSRAEANQDQFAQSSLISITSYKPVRPL